MFVVNLATLCQQLHAKFNWNIPPQEMMMWKTGTQVGGLNLNVPVAIRGPRCGIVNWIEFPPDVVQCDAFALTAMNIFVPQ